MYSLAGLSSLFLLLSSSASFRTAQHIAYLSCTAATAAALLPLLLHPAYNNNIINNNACLFFFFPLSFIFYNGRGSY
jgi:hypothetical protein